MKLPALPAFSLLVLLLAAGFPALLSAQEVDVGKIVSDAVKETKTTTLAPAAPESPKPVAASGDRESAEAILADLKEIKTATGLWAKEKRKPAKTKVGMRDIQPYLKPESPVAASGGTDRAGNPIDFGTVEAGPHVSSLTAKWSGQPMDFWGEFAPTDSKQDLATQTLGDLKQLRLAVLSWDADDAATRGAMSFEVLKAYLPADSEVTRLDGNDRLGNPFTLGTAQDPVHISAETYAALGMPRDFWGEFAPRNLPKGAPQKTTAHRKEATPAPKTFGRKFKDFFKGN